MSRPSASLTPVMRAGIPPCPPSRGASPPSRAGRDPPAGPGAASANPTPRRFQVMRGGRGDCGGAAGGRRGRGPARGGRPDNAGVRGWGGTAGVGTRTHMHTHPMHPHVHGMRVRALARTHGRPRNAAHACSWPRSHARVPARAAPRSSRRPLPRRRGPRALRRNNRDARGRRRGARVRGARDTRARVARASRPRGHARG